MQNGTLNGVDGQTAVLIHALHESSTKIRIQALKSLQQTLKDSSLELDTSENILHEIFLTYPRYQDRQSRKAVQACLRSALQNVSFCPKALRDLSQYLQAETRKPTIAPSNAFVLLEWCVLVQEEIAKADDFFETFFGENAIAAAQALEKCEDVRVRIGVRRSALVISRRGLRTILRSAKHGEGALRCLIERLTAGRYAVKENSPYLGVVAGVCSRLPSQKRQMAGYSGDVISFYIKLIMGSKSIVPQHVADGMHDFFAYFVSPETISRDLAPAFEKAMLRSPEVVLHRIVPSLVDSLPRNIDLSEAVHSSLLHPLLSNLKSSNAAVKDGARDALRALLKKCEQPEWLCKIAEDVISALRTAKVANSDYRYLLAHSLGEISPSPDVSSTITHGLCLVAAKESNETALDAEVAAVSEHLTFLLSTNSGVDQNVLDTIVKGCNEKRAPFRKIWLLKMGTTFWNLSKPAQSDESMRFMETVLRRMHESFTEISSNPLPALQSGIVSISFMMTALAGSKLLQSGFLPSIKQDVIARQALTVSPKPSYLLNSKIFTRLTSVEDMLWAVRALMGVAPGLAHASKESKVCWAQAVLYLLTSTDVAFGVRREAGEALSDAYMISPASVGESIVVGIWEWLRALAMLEKDSAAVASKTGNQNLQLALKYTNLKKVAWQEKGQDYPDTIVKNQLVSLLTLCRPDMLPGIDWIPMCLKSGIDPGELVQENWKPLLEEVLLRFEEGESLCIKAWASAACNSAADLAFVAPKKMTLLLVERVREDLDAQQFKDLGATESAIYRTAEGVAFIDVLDQKTNAVNNNKNRKNHDVIKWEEEIRSQLDQKKGQPKKLTADQQAKVDAQLRHEASVRQVVRRVVSNVRRGAGVVQSLANGPPVDASKWMSQSTRALLDALEAGAELFLEDEITVAYLACSNQVAARLGTLRQSIGVATLRAAGHTHLPEGFADEALGDLVTRVLYRLRFTAEQRQFDTVSLAYILPLIFIVLDESAVGYSPGEDADAQILLALEFLSFHMDSCSDTSLPRAQIMEKLIASMQRYAQHYRLIKDAIVDLCGCISTSIQQEEIEVLLKGITAPQTSVKNALLHATHTEIDLTTLDYSKEVWLACHDGDEENVELAYAVWEENGFSTEEALIFELPAFLRSADKPSRIAAAKALAEAVALNTSTFDNILSVLQDIYRSEAQPLTPKRDKYGMLQRVESKDPWEVRSGLAMAFLHLAPSFPPTAMVPMMRFLTGEGPLADRNAGVRNEMVEAGTQLVSIKGKDSLEPLMKLFEEILDAPDKGTEESDWINEAVIVLYGSLSRHLPPGDIRIQAVISKLLGTLSTPSESVQYAVAGCLPPLVRKQDTEIKSHIEQLLSQLFQGKQFASRRGAAYGLAGIISGKGILALRQYRVMSTLHSAADNKKSTEHRQGTLFAYELLSLILGRTFEPYVIEVLPQLLACFGDPNASVREACLDTAKTCFASLSSFGVRQVLPQLLEGLDDPQWRSKKGACDLLGAMAYLDPQQLASSLPDIIPPLSAVLNDSHKEVRASANRSLQRFGEVISNPEVKSLVNVLLKALSDPTKHTEEALDGLIKVSFVHYLDAPSLALVVRILERGLGDRSSTKRKAAQIIGSLAHLTERKDLISHLPILVSGLRIAAIDPVPATRATASKALGSLVEKLGEDALPDLIPNLMASLKSDSGAGDRLGSAQALSEVLAGLGTSRLEDTLPTILQNVSSTKPSVREGFMTLFIFLPACFGNSFATYLSQIIPSILGGLADDLEAIRDISLRAGRLLVKNFATKAIDLLLPELQRGLADDSYRIRLSSVELVGDLLFNLTGISNKAEADEEEESAAQAGQSLLEVLGEERRNKVLSSLYICRCDTSGMVRSAAIAVWKALVATPRTLRELVPTLTQMIITRLASSNMEQKVIAGNALGEVVRKAGEGVLAALLPSLEEGLQSSTDASNRQGICIALREVVTAASPEAVEEYEKKLISIVRIALVDSDADVREAAAESFDSLQQVFGKRAVDQVLPHLLNLLRDEAEAENALSALLTLLTEATRANVILPNLIPTLLSSPISSFNAKALASLAKVAGSNMTRRLPLIFNTLADNIVSSSEPELKGELESAFQAVLSAVDEFDGLNTSMSVMLTLIKHDDHRKRILAATQLGLFFSDPPVDYSRYNQDLIRVLLLSLDDRDIEVVRTAHTALTQLTAHLRKEEMESLVTSTRQILQQVGVAGSYLPGFSLPKGILPVLQIFLQGLMNGTSEQRMQSALAISDIIDRTGPDSLKPFVTQITGPLIRVVSERSVEVKCAILFTLNQLLEKIPTFLRPFLPQLQRTFTKSLADPSSDILRARATKALSTLITLTPRVDPLIAELVTGSKTQDIGVRNAMLKGLQEVVSKVGSNMSDTSKEAVLSVIDTNHNKENATTGALLLGSLIKVLPPAAASTLIRNRVISQPPTDASILALNAVLLESSSSLIKDFLLETRTILVQGISNKSPYIQQNCVLASGKFLLSDAAMASANNSIQAIFEALGLAVQPGGDVDTRRLALVVLRTIGRKRPEVVKPHLVELALPVFSSVRDPVIPVKLAAEAAFLELFSVVDAGSSVFDEYMAGPGRQLPVGTQRSMQDYFKRVAVRLGAQARDRKEAEGGQGGLGLASDEAEDEREIWSVGRVDLGTDAFAQD